MVLQDGIVTRYLNDHCPDPKLRLCSYRTVLPLDADTFLWGKSVFDKLGRFAGLGDEMRTIVLGSLRDYPALQIKDALIATARQLVTVGTGEGIVTSIWPHPQHYRTLHAIRRAGYEFGAPATRRDPFFGDQ